ncbi:MazG-like family protein [Shouchella shacheensis]|uniref:MazG-like family protein n=1 Tax=Shouchella shacheensis TaxID=1649580 RepID=UPI00073FE027|nr:MazG-like family protein [Shouchella shacheensis]
MEEILREIKELSIKEKKTLEQMVLKLTEEVGETSQAMLSYRQANGSEYKQLGLSDVKEECVDVMIVALALFYKLSVDECDLLDHLRVKVDKWNSVMT